MITIQSITSRLHISTVLKCWNYCKITKYFCFIFQSTDFGGLGSVRIPSGSLFLLPEWKTWPIILPLKFLIRAKRYSSIWTVSWRKYGIIILIGNLEIEAVMLNFNKTVTLGSEISECFPYWFHGRAREI